MVAKKLDTETIKKVIRQVEYYFSSLNLEWDTSLMKSITDSEDGMVNLAEICSLSNMKRYLGLEDNGNAVDVPEDIVEAVAETLKNSTTVKISEDGKKVGRKIDLEIELSDCRTIAASPFNKDVKIDDVTSFFELNAKVNSVKLIFGTALVEFSSEEDATKILTKSLDYKGAKLTLKTKKEFDEKKAKEEAENMLPKRKNDSQEEEYQRDLILAFELRRKTSKNSSEEKTDGKTESMDRVKNEAGEDVSLEDLKNVYKEFGTVQDIIKTGDVTGYVVFEDPTVAWDVRCISAAAPLAGLDVGRGKCYAILRGVTEDKEKAYWDNRHGKKKLKAGEGITEEDTIRWIV